jgi:hypothetical protein
MSIDLKKIILNVLEEGYFYVPLSVYKEMMDYYLDMYEKYKTLTRERATRKTFPPKTFKLNLKGTQWEFLSKYNPKIILKLTLNDENQHIDTYGTDGTVTLSLADFDRVTSEVMEHEVAHLIQELIKRHRNQKNKFGYRAPQRIGGLPPKRFIDQKYNDQGRLKDSISDRRTDHTLRPVEYYTDLLSVLRNLQASYYDKIKNKPNYKKLLKSEKDKKAFFMDYYNKVKNTSKEGAWIVGKFKSLPNNFFNYAFKIMYNAFVNTDSNVDWDYIRKRKEEIINKAKITKESSNIPKFERGGVTFSLRNDYFDLGPMEMDGTNDFTTEHILPGLGLKSTKEDRWGDSNYYFPKDEKGIIRIFTRLRKLKEGGELPFIYFYDDYEPSKKDIDAIYDNIFEDIMYRYTSKIDSPIVETIEGNKKIYKKDESIEKKFIDFVTKIYKG